MATVLVVANETLASRSLVNAIRERHEAGDASFVIVAPTAKATSGFVSYDDVVRDAAETRIDMMLANLREHGIEARGEVFDPDPYSAVLDAVAIYRPREIIISTHPASRSGWLGRDLLERVEDSTGLPVTHVVTDLEAERDDVTHTLVLAAQTARGEALLDRLRAKAKESPHRFIVTVPQTGTDGHYLAEARERLLGVLDDLRGEGFDAIGSVGDPDPFTAAMNALSFYKVDEIVVSTLPDTRSGWLRADLVDRIRRAVSPPVEHVVGAPAAEGQPAR